MGKRGPAPKPTRLKELQGNPGKRALNTSEPQPDTSKPNCPSFLDRVARAEWRRVAGKLHAAGLLSYVDRAALAAYCQAYSDWVRLTEELEGEETILVSEKGYHYANPLCRMAGAARADMVRLAREFGMTPSARSGVLALLPEKADDLVSELFSNAY